MDRIQGKWCDTELKDMMGNKFSVGQRVVRACTAGRASNLEICEVTRIENGKLYLSESKVPIVYPGRLLIL